MSPACGSRKGEHGSSGLAKSGPRAGHLHSRRRAASALAPGFTLVEIVIALTLIIIIAAAAMPMFRGFRDEQLAREPITELVRLAKEARLHAMREKRPYQIAFHSGGFTASRYLSPYLQLAQLNDFLAASEAAAQEPEGPAPEEPRLDPTLPGTTKNESRQTIMTKSSTASAFKDWMEDYKLPPETRYTLKHWYENEPVPIEGEVVKLWVFQPTGICQPVTVRLEREGGVFEVEFGAMTADIVKERSSVL